VATPLFICNTSSIILDNKYDLFFLAESENVLNKTISSSAYLPTIKSKSIQKYRLEKDVSSINATKIFVDNNLLPPSPSKSIKETLPINKK
jgi:hypothetical protein